MCEYLLHTPTEKYFCRREWNGHWCIFRQWKVNPYTLKGRLHGFFDRMWMLSKDSRSDGNGGQIHISEGNALRIHCWNVNINSIMIIWGSLSSRGIVQNWQKSAYDRESCNSVMDKLKLPKQERINIYEGWTTRQDRSVSAKEPNWWYIPKKVSYQRILTIYLPDYFRPPSLPLLTIGQTQGEYRLAKPDEKEK